MEEKSIEYDDVKSAKIFTMYEDYQGVELLQAINNSRDQSLLLSNKEFKKIHRVRKEVSKSEFLSEYDHPVSP